MPHHPLLATIIMGLVLAFVFGAIAHRFKLSPLVGYLLAGVCIGPFTPGFVADQALALQLAELGVILLMFGVGLHFSLRDLMAVRLIAIPGAVVQILIATLLGMVLATALGWTWGAGLVFGLALSVASTVVLLRALTEHNLIESEQGRIAVGWLIVEDIAMVLALVLLPVLAPQLGGELPEGAAQTSLVAALALMVLKLAAFGAVIHFVGRRVIPRVLHYVARSGSRELFRLAVLAIALGVAYGSAELFGVSFALGAFFAGMILAESPLSHQAAEETLPLRDAFAVLFFVSVGMLFNPSVIVTHPWSVLATFLIIVFGKSVAAYLIVGAAGYTHGTAVTISAALAQIGEFSFILAGLGVSLQVMPEEGRDLILAGAILSIMVNPVLFTGLEKVKAWSIIFKAKPSLIALRPLPSLPDSGTALTNHAIILGYQKPGISVARALLSRGIPIYVVETREANVTTLNRQLYEAVEEGFVQYGPAEGANFAGATALILTTSAHEWAQSLATQARQQNPNIHLIGFAADETEANWLESENASLIIDAETDQTSASSQIADFLSEDCFAHAQRGTYDPNH